MDILTFTAEIVKALAWPVSIIVLLFSARKWLAQLIPRLLKLKYKDFEAEFSEVLKRLESHAEKAQLPPVDSHPLLPDGKQVALWDRHVRLAAISPRAAMLEATRELNQAIRRLAEPADWADLQDEEHPVLSWTISRLRSEGKLDSGSAAMYEDLSKLQIQALEADVTVEQAIAYVTLAGRLTARMKEIEATKASEVAARNPAEPQR